LLSALLLLLLLLLPLPPISSVIHLGSLFL
jgi:hypothetical protein